MSSNMRVTVAVSNDMERRLLSYGTLVLAGLAGSAVPANAAIVHTIDGRTITGDDSIVLDVDNDSNPDFFFNVFNCPTGCAGD